ncbi:WD40 repeat domain-containing protein [Hyalangium rubrum]|uniref:WD40 repeat domain-containing protein n=1 Tax=Hyalangium rubrum TaxID=3103134 RepID=A0ABU5H5K2_9BACT|nr:WD40 repeat domain-containing protein [Hyalangium sp. s54d21]MDY7228149.1 WD40 repeat domain-containing protein [Hyalangium sp. s54d21]
MKHLGPISGVSAYQDKYIATAGYDNQLILWEGLSRTPIARAYHDHLANQCAFSPCGRYLVSSSSDHTARVWELPYMKLRAVLSHHQDDVEMAAFNARGDLVATCSRDHTVRVFSIDGQLRAEMHGHESDVISVSWERDSDRVISSSDDGTIRRWDARTGQLLETIDLGDVETDTIAIAEDGMVFAGNDNGEILLLAKEGIRRIPAHAAGIKRLVYNRGQLVSLSYDRNVMIWAYEEGTLRRLRVSEFPSIVWPRSCAFFGESKLAFGTFGSTYALYDYASDTWDTGGIDPDISLNAVAHAHGSTYAIGDAGVAFKDGKPISELGSLCNFLLPFGSSVLTGGQMGRVFDAVSGKCIYQHRSPLNCGATFIKDGVPHAVIGAYTGEGLVFRREGQDIVYVATVSLHENAIKGVACSQGILFSVCATGAAAMHRLSDFGLMRRIDKAHDRIANGCAALPDGRFASISRDRKLRLWTGGKAEAFESPHRHSIKCIAASSDGRWIATGDYAGSVAIFDVEQRRWVRFTRPTAAGISNVAAAREPGRFTASSYDGQLYEVGVSSVRRVAAAAVMEAHP